MEVAVNDENTQFVNNSTERTALTQSASSSLSSTTRDIYNIFRDRYNECVNVFRDNETASVADAADQVATTVQQSTRLERCLKFVRTKKFLMTSMVIAAIAYAALYVLFFMLGKLYLMDPFTATFVLLLLLLFINYPISNFLYRRWYGSSQYCELRTPPESISDETQSDTVVDAPTLTDAHGQSNSVTDSGSHLETSTETIATTHPLVIQTLSHSVTDNVSDVENSIDSLKISTPLDIPGQSNSVSDVEDSSGSSYKSCGTSIYITPKSTPDLSRKQIGDLAKISSDDVSATQAN